MTSQLTIEQRKACYWAVSESFQGMQNPNRAMGACAALIAYAVIHGFVRADRTGRTTLTWRDFPEFAEQRPRQVYDGGYWWPFNEAGRQHRVKALLAACANLETAAHV
jgi:hypothetical protein